MKDKRKKSWETTSYMTRLSISRWVMSKVRRAQDRISIHACVPDAPAILMRRNYDKPLSGPASPAFGSPSGHSPDTRVACQKYSCTAVSLQSTAVSPFIVVVGGSILVLVPSSPSTWADVRTSAARTDLRRHRRDHLFINKIVFLLSWSDKEWAKPFFG